MLFHWSLLFILGYFSTPTAARTTEHFDYRTQLFAKNNYMFYWKHNATHLTFEIHADTTGFVGFGFSKNGSMFPGDVMLARVANGAKHIYVSSNFIFRHLLLSFQGEVYLIMF